MGWGTIGRHSGVRGEERILGATTPEQLQETTLPDVEEPFQMFIKVLIEALLGRSIILLGIGGVGYHRVGEGRGTHPRSYTTPEKSQETS